MDIDLKEKLQKAREKKIENKPVLVTEKKSTAEDKEIKLQDGTRIAFKNFVCNPPHITDQIIKQLEGFLTKEDKEYLSKTSLMIGTPCFGGNVCLNYLVAMLDTVVVLKHFGVNYKLQTIGTESLINRGRNYICAEFLGSECDHLLFIDADLGFKPDLIIRLLLSRKEVISAIYPLKQYNWDKIIKYIKSKDSVDIEQMILSTSSFVWNCHDYSSLDPKGFVKVIDAPTGFMMIRRSVLQKLINHKEVVKYVNDTTGYDTVGAKGNFYTFFECMVCPQSNRLLSEDYAFTRRCQNIKIDFWGDIAGSIMTHAGPFIFQGSLGSSLENDKIISLQRSPTQ